jgi:CrcB protein
LIAASSRRSFLGGAIGALARYGLAEALPHEPGTWPWATFAVNVAGALALGYVATRLQERRPRPIAGPCSAPACAAP